MSGSAVFGHFIGSAERRLHVLCRDPSRPVGRTVLVVPPFGEEMNKSRRMITELALRLAAARIATIVPDLYGTGDSGGDFADADWTGWLADLRCVRDWCAARGTPITAILGIRLGCALAVEAVASGVLEPVERTVLWQPVLDGKRFLTQVLRLRVAASAMAGDSSETATTLRARLAAGETLEVAGYALSGRLATQLETLATPAVFPEQNGAIHWLETIREAGSAAPEPQIVKATRARGTQVEWVSIVGEPFWAATEIVSNAQLVEASATALTASSTTAPGTTDREPLVARVSDVLATVTQQEQSLSFNCHGSNLVGILHCAPGAQRFGILVIVGGPQYRVGSHRQFVLMARALAAADYPVLRFDYRGMGDSEGEPRTFESVSEDIRAALDAFLTKLPHLDGIFLFGLCDAASAALMYGTADPRVKGMIIANPWVRTSAGEAKAIVRHYYARRLLQGSFWKQLFTGKVRLWESALSLVQIWRRAHESTEKAAPAAPGNFLERMLRGMEHTRSPVLVLISEHDLTAQEFVDRCAESPRWERAFAAANVSKSVLAGADHTFSSAAALAHANAVAITWLEAASSRSGRSSSQAL